MLLKINLVKEEIAAATRKVYLTEDEAAKKKKNCDLLEKGKNHIKSETIHIDAFLIKNIEDKRSNFLEISMISAFSDETASSVGLIQASGPFLLIVISANVFVFQYFICFSFRN